MAARHERLLALALIAGFLLIFFFLCSCEKKDLIEPLDFFDTSKPERWPVCTGGCGGTLSQGPSNVPPPESAGICTGANPTSGSLCIQYTLIAANDVSLSIYSPKAELIKDLVRESKLPGTFSVYWDLTDIQGHPVPNGVYRAYFNVGGDVSYGDITVAR